MKKAICLLVIVLLTLPGFVGCSSNTKSEAQLKEEIKKELAAEIAKEKEDAAQKEQNADKEQAASKEQPAQQQQNAGQKQPAAGTQPSQQNSQGGNQETANAPSLLKEYHVNYEYKYDIDGDGGIDTFNIMTDNMNKLNLVVNSGGYEKKLPLEGLTPELVFDKYKLTRIADYNRYAFTIYVASPPNEQEIYFYEFVKRSELMEIGRIVNDNVAVNGDFFDYDFHALTYNSVALGQSSLQFSDYRQEFRAGEEEPENLKLSGFRNETINGTQINYSDYRLVVVPMYDGLNTLHWVNQDIGSVTQGPQGMQVNFAIFGHLNDIKITYYQGMDDPGTTINVGTLYDAHVGVRVWLPNNDMSHIGVSGVADLGNGDLRKVEFGLDDMRDSSEYEVIMLR